MVPTLAPVAVVVSGVILPHEPALTELRAIRQEFEVNVTETPQVAVEPPQVHVVQLLESVKLSCTSCLFGKPG